MSEVARDVVREEVPKIVKEEVKHLPTKEEFYKRSDQVMKKLETREQEDIAKVGKESEFEERIAALEQIHPHGTHTAR